MLLNLAWVLLAVAGPPRADSFGFAGVPETGLESSVLLLPPLPGVPEAETIPMPPLPVLPSILGPSWLPPLPVPAWAPLWVGPGYVPPLPPLGGGAMPLVPPPLPVVGGLMEPEPSPLLLADGAMPLGLPQVPDTATPEPGTMLLAGALLAAAAGYRFLPSICHSVKGERAPRISTSMQ